MGFLPDGSTLVVSETTGFANSCVPDEPDGSLGAPSVFADLGADRHPDGLCVDVEGGVWVGCVDTGEFLRVTRGRQRDPSGRDRPRMGGRTRPRRTRRPHAVHGDRRHHFRGCRRTATRRGGSCKRVSMSQVPDRHSVSLWPSPNLRTGRPTPAHSRQPNVRCGWRSSMICSPVALRSTRPEPTRSGPGATRPTSRRGARVWPDARVMLLVLHFEFESAGEGCGDAHRRPTRTGRCARRDRGTRRALGELITPPATALYTVHRRVDVQTRSLAGMRAMRRRGRQRECCRRPTVLALHRYG